MDDLLERALDLWQAPVPEGDAGVARFRTVYADPVTVNGTPTDLVVLVERARMLQRCFDTVGREVDSRFARPTGGARSPSGSSGVRSVRWRPRSASWRRPAGDSRPTAWTSSRSWTGGCTGIWAILDWLDLLTQAGAVTMSDGG